MGEAAAARRTAGDEVLAAIVAAARRCFARYGVHRTRMEDVAHEAGVSRPTVYRYVSGRSELIELALVETVREIGERMSAHTETDAPDLRAAFLNGLVASVEVTREDAEFAYLAEAIGRVPLANMLAAPDSDVHAAVVDWLRPLFDRARRDGLLRTDVPEDDVVTWVQGVLVLVTPREDMDAVALREALSRFLLPVVFRSEPR